MPIHTHTLSNIFIALSVVTTVWLEYIFWNTAYLQWWMNTYYLNVWDYGHYFLQFFSSQFLHWGFFHLLMNGFFLYYFWNIVEIILWRKKYFIFFLFITLFNWVLLSYFAWNVNTIWISWFAMAIISYYTLELYELKNPEYKWWITMIIVNIAIWLSPWISLEWHLFWAIWWALFYLINRNWLNKVLVWLCKSIWWKSGSERCMNSEILDEK